MANTYTQIHIQVVFAVQNRLCLISDKWQDELYKYISGIVNNNGHKMLAINGMPDHVHVFFGMRPSQSLSDLMQDIKGNSSKWINQKRFVIGRFAWQEGYGGFSYCRSEVQNVINHINNQKEHHARGSFVDEYIGVLKENEIEYDDRYVFMPVDLNDTVPDGTV